MNENLFCLVIERLSRDIDNLIPETIYKLWDISDNFYQLLEMRAEATIDIKELDADRYSPSVLEEFFRIVFKKQEFKIPGRVVETSRNISLTRQEDKYVIVATVEITRIM